MNPAILPYLRCPVCGLPLAPADSGDTQTSEPTVNQPTATTELTRSAEPTRTVRCPRGHSFDAARQGYLNLSAGRVTHAGDSAEMVAARTDFLAAGHYDFISATLTEVARTEVARIEPARIPVAGAEAARTTDRTYPDLVVDAGAGTGRHLAAVLDGLPDAVGLALDISKPALRRAARAHPRAGAVLCDTWGPLPLVDESVTVLLNVFAPRNGPEFRRVLRADGVLLVVTPDADHLHELVDRLDLLHVDPAKADRVAGSLAGHFDLADRTAHRRRLALTRPEVHTLVEMGPSAWHTDPDRLAARIRALPEPVEVTASIRLAVYRPRT